MKLFLFIKGIFRVIFILISIVISFCVCSTILLELLYAKDELKYRNLPEHLDFAELSAKSNKTKLVLFGACAVNLAETTRMVTIADHLHSKHPEIKIAFFSYDGIGSFNYTYPFDTKYKHYVLSPPFESEEQIERFYRIDCGDEFGDIFPYEILKKRVKSELELYRVLKPDLVVTGFVLSAKLSSQIANIPHYFTVPLVAPNYDYYLQRLPHLSQKMKDIIIEMFPRRMLNRIFIHYMKRIWYQTTPFIQVSLNYGVKPKINSLHNLLEGNTKTFITEIPEMVKLDNNFLNQVGNGKYSFVGPLFYKDNNRDIPPFIQEAIQKTKEEGKEIIYFAMGSSGIESSTKSIASELSNALQNNSLGNVGLVIAPIKRIVLKESRKVEGEEFLKSLDERIIITEPNLPAPKLNEICDYGILHGGQGTIQTALLSGLPFVALPTKAEQTNNIMTAISSAKSGLIVPNGTGNDGKAALQFLRKVMEDKQFTINAKEFKNVNNLLCAEEIITENIIEEIG